MSDFPELIPNSISFSHGQPNISEYRAFGTGPITFRHSNYVNDQTMELQYIGLSETSVQEIRDHYNVVGGIFGTFNAPLSIWGGAGIAQTDSQYKYVETPQEVHTGLHFNVTVSLRLLQGKLVSFILDGGGSELSAEQEVEELVFEGTSPFVLEGSDSDAATLILDAGAS
jgi:hypothetical protein|tara:strand:+ start:1015 stop:1524 length:510 start_codon:yes stop_codon:yes gene_type:complete